MFNRKRKISMKKIFIAIFAVVVSAVSCLNLDEVAYSKMTADNYYENFSESDIPAALGTIYSDLRKLYAGGSAHTDGNWHYTNEEVSDIWITPKRGGAWYDGGVYFRLNQHIWDWEHAHILNNWRQAYSSINTCNRLMHEFRTAEVKDTVSLMAELKVARAFWYYNLCDMYGNVPLQTRYDVPEGYLPSTSTRQQVFDFVVSEIDDNIEHLAKKAYGRWDQNSAKMLLAKCYLNAASWNVNVEGNAWDKVISLCDEIMTTGGYALEADYKSSFITENQGSKEIIMGIINDEVYDEGMPWRLHLCTMHWKYYCHANTVTQYWGGCCATPEFAYSYDPDDLRYEKSWLEGQLYDNTGAETGKPGTPLECDPWDSRDVGKLLIHTKDVPIYTDENGNPDGIPTTGEGPGVRMLKYEIKQGALNRLSNDFVLFRLADVYFMKAEALYWKNGGSATQEVCDLINEVRRRAFTNFTADKQVTVGELDDDRFLLEYGWEFCQEGHRRQQLIRFGQFLTKTWFLHDTPTMDPNRLLFPIPRQEMLANPNLTQNPGYQTLQQ